MSIFGINDVNTVVSFSLYGSAIAGDFKDARLLSLGSAYGYNEYNPREKHDAMYSSLPEPKPRNHTDYVYYLLLLANGQTVVIGDAWIRPNTVIKGNSNKAVITVKNVNAATLSALERLIRSGNYEIESAVIQNG